MSESGVDTVAGNIQQVASSAGDRDLANRMLAAAAQIVRSAQAAEWRGIDLHDGLYWRWPPGFVATPLRRQAIVQLHVRAPIDLRGWRHGPRPRLAKTLALFAKASLLAGDGLPDSNLTEAGRAAATMLNSDRGAGDQAWGYPFPVQTRWSRYDANTPNVVVTSFAIDALLLAAQRIGDAIFEDRARAAALWIADKLVTSGGHIAYHEDSDVLIHNASLLGTTAVYRALGERATVNRALEPTLNAQRADGSWPYGAGPRLQFVDSFHTGYVLASLIALREVDSQIDSVVRKGAAYWTHSFFDDAGRSLLWPNREFPEDGHSAGTALTTLALLAGDDAGHLPLLRRVAERALEAMIIDGRVVHRRHRWGRTQVNYVRWCDGHMALGLAVSAARLAGQATMRRT